MRRSIIGVIATTIVSTLLHHAAHAITLGFHDTSDPVKTNGWACDTSSSAPVRVHLYADIDGRLVHLDSQLADRRRDDLPFVCNGAAHAFRFADYATTPEGVALYSRSTPVAMRVLVETATGQQQINGSPRSVSFAAVGLWDPGLVSGRWRTDLDDPREGTINAPLLLGECTFATPVSDGYPAFSGGGGDGSSTACRYGSIVNPASNAASSDGTWPRKSYWVVTANVEPAIAKSAVCRWPSWTKSPRAGAWQRIALWNRRASRWRILTHRPTQDASRSQQLEHRRLSRTQLCNSLPGIRRAGRSRQQRRDHLCEQAGIEDDVVLGLTLMDIAEKNAAFGVTLAGASRYRQSHVLIEASWGGRKRWLFIELLPDARRVADTGDDRPPTHVRLPATSRNVGHG